MYALKSQQVLVIGLGASGQAACRLLLQRGAQVTALDSADSKSLRFVAEQLRSLGITVELGAMAVPLQSFDLVVVSPGVPNDSRLMREVFQRQMRVIGEFELGYQQSLCPNIAITGTNGKTTSTELVERMLTQAHRKTIPAGNIGVPVCAVADQTKELDFLTLEVSSFQLETIEFFRPAVAVLLNLTPDHMDRYASMADYVRAKARLFLNQQSFDWAIIQSEALEQIQSLDLPIPAKIITFSANIREADLYLDRGLLISRLADWTGPLLDMDECQLRGPHNAENLMAVLAVGRVLRLPLEQMVESLKTYAPAPHRCERILEISGVQFVNDSKATNLAAVEKALLSMPVGKSGERNVFLIAGGKDKGLSYHDLGPLLSRRVKHAFLLGETREKIRAAWSLFTPCSPVDSLLEAVSKAFENAAFDDVVLLSPACSSFDMFQNYQHRGEVFRQAAQELACAIERNASGGSPNAGRNHANDSTTAEEPALNNFAPRFCEGKPRSEQSQTLNTSNDHQPKVS